MAAMASNLLKSRWMEMMCVMWEHCSNKLLQNKKGGELKFKKNLWKSSVPGKNSFKDLCIYDFCMCYFMV